MNSDFSFSSLSSPTRICSRPLLRIYSLKSSISVNGNELVYASTTVPCAIFSLVPFKIRLCPVSPCNTRDAL